jgi:hypothetical protein
MGERKALFTGAAVGLGLGAVIGALTYHLAGTRKKSQPKRKTEYERNLLPAPRLPSLLCARSHGRSVANERCP